MILKGLQHKISEFNIACLRSPLCIFRESHFRKEYLASGSRLITYIKRELCWFVRRSMHCDMKLLKRILANIETTCQRHILTARLLL